MRHPQIFACILAKALRQSPLAPRIRARGPSIQHVQPVSQLLQAISALVFLSYELSDLQAGLLLIPHTAAAPKPAQIDKV